jgi:hypothetical protein
MNLDETLKMLQGTYPTLKDMVTQTIESFNPERSKHWNYAEALAIIQAYLNAYLKFQSFRDANNGDFNGPYSAIISKEIDQATEDLDSLKAW